MSIQAIAWVLENSEATLADRLVLLAIANHADARGRNAWPAIPLIAREARVDERTVYRALQALEQRGEIVIVKRPGRSSYYGLTALMTPDKLSPLTPDNLSGEGSQIVRGTPDKLSPKPSFNRQGTVSRGRAREATDTSPIPAGPVRLPSSLDKDTRARGAEYFRNLRLRQDDAS